MDSSDMGSRPRDRLGRLLAPGSPDERRYADPSRAATSFADALEKACGLYEEGRFFEAHEFFEHLWKSPEAAPTDRGFWQGLAQDTAAWCHLQRDNPRGARVLFERALAHLSPYPSPHHGIATEGLRLDAHRALERLQAGVPAAGIPLPSSVRARGDEPSR